MNIDMLMSASIEELDFCVVDTETTGMYAQFNRVIDIGIVRIKNLEIVDTWETLINPDQAVPFWITNITGINDYDLIGRPNFSNYLPKIRSYLDDSIFVAHNKDFDYSFIKEEYRRLGVSFLVPSLCTVLLSRKLLPNLESANLDSLAEHFKVPIEGRHRALPDAHATAVIFLKLIEIAKGKFGSKSFFDLEKLQKVHIERKFNDLKDIEGSLFA